MPISQFVRPYVRREFRARATCMREHVVDLKIGINTITTKEENLWNTITKVTCSCQNSRIYTYQGLEGIKNQGEWLSHYPCHDYDQPILMFYSAVDVPIREEYARNNQKGYLLIKGSISTNRCFSLILYGHARWKNLWPVACTYQCPPSSKWWWSWFALWIVDGSSTRW